MSMRGLGAWALAGLICAAAAADTARALTADQIVEKNVAARGGLEAWRKIRTMVWTGRIGGSDPSTRSVPFVLEYKRPGKTRFEMRAEHEKSVRVFDGATGWKIRTLGRGGPSVRPYSPVELRSAHDAQGIDGLLIDHQANGIEVALEGADDVEGHQAYRLSARLPSGSTRRVWVDAQTFLELRVDRESHARGSAIVSTLYRDYRSIDGLQIPMTVETGKAGSKAAEKMVIDAVTLNASLSDAHFERPDPVERGNALPGLRSAAPDDGVPPALESK
jgi:hypothetical protein